MKKHTEIPNTVKVSANRKCIVLRIYIRTFMKRLAVSVQEAQKIIVRALFRLESPGSKGLITKTWEQGAATVTYLQQMCTNTMAGGWRIAELSSVAQLRHTESETGMT